jgi:hypothetical protein
MWGTLSDERTGLSFTIAAGPRQHIHSCILVPRASWPYFTVSDLRLPQTGGPGPCTFYIPQGQVAQLYHQALGSLFVTSYNSQDDGGGIRTCLHKDLTKLPCLPSLYSFGMDHIENTAPSSSLLLLTYLLPRLLPSSGQSFNYHVTI